jgi:hypothetical protein
MSLPRPISAIVEDEQGNVIGASFENSPGLILPPEDRFHRSELRAKAIELCTRYNITLPGHPALSAPVPDGA